MQGEFLVILQVHCRYDGGQRLGELARRPFGGAEACDDKEIQQY